MTSLTSTVQVKISETDAQFSLLERFPVPVELVRLSERPVELALISTIFEAQHLTPLQQHAVFAAVSRHVCCEDTYLLHHALREQDGVSSGTYTGLLCGRSEDPVLVALWGLVRTSLDSRLVPDQLERHILHQLGLSVDAIDEVSGLITVAQLCIDLSVGKATGENLTPSYQKEKSI